MNLVSDFVTLGKDFSKKLVTFVVISASQARNWRRPSGIARPSEPCKPAAGKSLTFEPCRDEPVLSVKFSLVLIVNYLDCVAPVYISRRRERAISLP